MPITENDIKIYKSSAMLDADDGGGPMSGVVVVDGVSNNMFPDTSAVDRSRGRVQFRSVFGVAETANTDTLLGTHAMLTKPPADPLVHAALLKPASWGGTVADFRQQVERYLLKGVRITSRLVDTHYAGSVMLQLISVSGTDFPAANDVVVLVNPSAAVPDQYVRALTVKTSRQEFTVIEGGGVMTFTAWLAQLELSVPLEHDQPGPPASRAVSSEDQFTRLYSTTRASGAAFYGIRPLSTAAGPGQLVAHVDTVFHPVVPAATSESPLVDLGPYQAVSGVAHTGSALVSLPAQVVNAGPGFVWRLPTAFKAGTLRIDHGGVVLTDYLGVLRDGPTPVGTVDYVAATAGLDGTAPAYGSASSVVSFVPGTKTSGVMHSKDVQVTLANSGLAWVADLEPPPVPGSVVVEYMAQGQWYTLRDTGGMGKLTGADAAHGVGTANYATGSVASTFGAIPDTDSVILYTWAAGQSAVAVHGPVPARASTVGGLTVSGGAAGDVPIVSTMAWTVLGAARSATSTGGALSGDATGNISFSSLTRFAPAEVPDAGSVTWSGTKFTPGVRGNIDVPTSGMTFAIGVDDLAGVSAKAGIAVTPAGGNWVFDPVLEVSIVGTDVIVQPWGVSVGAVSLATGNVTLAASVTLPAPRAVGVQTGTLVGQTLNHYFEYSTGDDAVCTINGFAPFDPGAQLTYWRSGATSAATGSVVLDAAWTVLPKNAQMNERVPALAQSVLATVFGAVLTVEGTPRFGWDIATGARGTAVGTFDPATAQTVVNNPPPGASTELTLFNIAQSRSATCMTSGTFRTQTAPLKPGSMQLSSNNWTASVASAGNITGDFSGTVDSARGIVRWRRTGSESPSFFANWSANADAAGLYGATPDSFTYNAVFLQFLPLDAGMLGIDTSRLPLDGRVPYVRRGDTVVVHHTLQNTMPNPIALGAAQYLGRTRIAAVRVLDAAGAKVASDRYTTDLDVGNITFTQSLAAYTQPLAVHHRIEDMMLVRKVDISGAVSFTAPLTHHFPPGESYLSSALLVGDVQARAYNQFEQLAWLGEWTDAPVGPDLLANYNEAASPIGVTNAGAIDEDWALIFTSSTSFRIVGRSVGEIGTGSINTLTEPTNPATMVPFWSMAAIGFGSGWASGNVVRFKTAPAGANFVVVRTVLQGPDTESSDRFTIAFRGDVNA